MSDLFDKYGHPIRVLINPDCPSDLFDKSGRPHIVVENADGIDLSTSEFLPALLRGSNLLHIPTNAGWIAAVVGSGSTTQAVSRLSVGTGATAGSEARLHSRLTAFNWATAHHININWDKKVYIIFNVTREESSAAAICRFQVKEITAEGQLAAKGLGIRIDNFVLKGESYGTSLGVVDLATTLTSTYPYQIVIIHYPGSKIEWYVNGVLKGTQLTVANIPSGIAVAQAVCSSINGATAANATLNIAHPKIWQEA